MKAILLSASFLFLGYQIQAQTIQRKDAADAINFIDTLVIPLKNPANELSGYLQQIRPGLLKANDYKLSLKQIDQFRKYYQVLTAVYINAIKKATQNKKIDKFPGLKTKFLNMLNEGQKPWVTIIPLYIKMFSNGKSTMSVPEQNLINNASSLFTNSATTTLEFSKVLAEQLEEIEKKYPLELSGKYYR